MSRVYLGWSMVATADLDKDGSDLLGALAGRIPEDDPDLIRFLQRSVNDVSGWRLIYEGTVPDWPGGRAIRLAAPTNGGWQVATFVPQEDGGWGAMLEPGPIQPHTE